MKLRRFAIILILLLLTLAESAQDLVQTQSPPKIEKPLFFVDNVTIIRGIHYEGLDDDRAEHNKDADTPTIFLSDFRRALSQQSVTRIDHDEIRWSDIENLLLFLGEWLGDRSFQNANVAVRATALDERNVKLIISVDRGKPSLVSDIIFEGTKNVTAQELRDDFKQCLGDRLPIFDRRLYEYCAEKNSRSFMHSRGYFTAKINSISPRRVKDELVVRIEITEGIRYRWGEIKIKNARAYTETEVLEMFGERSGNVANGAKLQDFVYDRLKIAYNERGYAQYSAEFDPELIAPLDGEVDGTANVLIDIDEGRRFAVRKIEFRGVEPEEAKVVTELMTLRVGDLFIPSKLDASLERINKMDGYEPLDKYQDVEISVDGESADIYLKILFRKVDR